MASPVNEHVLLLDIPATACPQSMRIIDMSVYSSLIPVDCERLDILVPGYSTAAVFSYDDAVDPLDEGFDRVFSAADIGVQANFPSSLSDLPDGLYIIQYSVSPNEVKYVKYYHLRTTILLNDYYKELCKLQLAQCEPTAETKQKLADLRFIKSLIDAAKAKAEWCLSTGQAVDMYNYAVKMLNKYKTGCCVTCC